MRLNTDAEGVLPIARLPKKDRQTRLVQTLQENPFATDEEVAEIMASPAYAEMAVYPYYGCMQMIDDILVVKLS